MSLRERLSGEQAALQAQKLEAQKSEQEQALAPVRTRIAQIEDAQKDLECVKEVSFVAKLQNFEIENRQIEEE